MWPLIAFNIAYMLAAVITALRGGNSEFIFYIGVMILLMGTVLLLHRRLGFSMLVMWGMSLWGLLHMSGGLVPVPQSWPINGETRVLYSWWLVPGYLKYDNIVHGFGFGVTTLLCWEALRTRIAGRTGATERTSITPTWGLVVLCGAASLGFGALNEIVEFVATLLMPNTNVGGYINTGWDLVSNLVGVSVAMVAIRLKR